MCSSACEFIKYHIMKHLLATYEQKSIIFGILYLTTPNICILFHFDFKCFSFEMQFLSFDYSTRWSYDKLFSIYTFSLFLILLLFLLLDLCGFEVDFERQTFRIQSSSSRVLKIYLTIQQKIIIIIKNASTKVCACIVLCAVICSKNSLCCLLW